MKRVFAFVMATLLVAAGAWAEVADTFDYPLPTTTCSSKPGPWLGFVKKAGYRLGENLGHTDGTSAAGEVVESCANGTVCSITASGDVNLGTVVVIEHELIDNTLAYSIYGQVSPTVSVGQEVWLGGVIGSVTGNSLYFEISTAPWTKGEKVFIKKVTLEALSGRKPPSAFIDLRQDVFDISLPKNTWPQFQLHSSCQFGYAWISWGGVNYSLPEAVSAIALNNEGKEIYPGEQPQVITFTTGRPIGFSAGAEYQLRGLKDGVVAHFYQPAYRQMAEVIEADLLKVASLYKPNIGFAKPKTFKPVNKLAEPGFKAYQMRFKSGYAPWGNQITIVEEYSAADPYIRRLKFLDTSGNLIFGWTPWEMME